MGQREARCLEGPPGAVSVLCLCPSQTQAPAPPVPCGAWLPVPLQDLGQVSALSPLPHPLWVLPLCQTWPGSPKATLGHPLPGVQRRPHEGHGGSALRGPWQPGGEGSPRRRTWPSAPADPEPGFTVVPTSCCRSLISWCPGWAGPRGDTRGCSTENLKRSFRIRGWGL